MINPKYDPAEVEKHVLHHWNKNKIYELSKKKNAKGEKFYFLQGPPYTSGRLHMGHAWNHSLKDLALRYKRMKGFDVLDRAGYDMHGLPTEHKVMEKHKLETKEDIEKFGYDKFAKECFNFSTEMAKLMDKDLQRMGVWLDYSDPYYPVKNEFMEGEWFLIKKAHEAGRLYEAERTLSWCASCGTALAKHEQEYEVVKENSIFVKFKVKNTENEYLIIWTTTPWTIAYNLAVMVNPELDYVKIKVDNEYWVVAKALVGIFLGSLNKKYEIVEEFKGDKLEGTEYVHPWADEIPQFAEFKAKCPKVHTVIMSHEYVDTTAGSGLVHSAPGCGPEDYEVGHRNGILPFNNLKEDGYFPDDMGKFAGLKAKTDDKKFIKALDEVGALITSTPVEHDYAHCQRCHNPIVFRVTKQWFFKIEDLKDELIKENQDVHWVPNQGKESFDLWIKNLRDNSLTKQRFWGTPIPIWRCPDCKEYVVVGSAKELKELGANKVPKNLHKPFIDDVTLPCKCGSVMKRIPDVIDVWIDAGSVSWISLYYPEKEDLLEKYYPADFVLEAKEQVRLWFYVLAMCSKLALQRPAYKNVYLTGMLLSVDGIKMSKSLGNIISPYEIIDKDGTDAMRYYLSSIRAGLNVSFSWDEITQKKRNLIVLWNLHKYIVDTASMLDINPAKLDAKVMQASFSIEERYIVSKTNNAIKKITELLEKYELDSIVDIIEEIYLELSRSYVQLVREKLATGSEEDKEVVLFVLYDCLDKIVRMFHVVCPFITEEIYLDFKEAFSLEDESIILGAWPEHNEKLIDSDLEAEFEISKNIAQAILYSREKVKLGVRWPLKEVVVVSKDEFVTKTVDVLGDLIKTQTNIKKLLVQEEMPNVKVGVLADFKKLAPEFGALAKPLMEEVAGLPTDSILKALDKDQKVVIKFKDNDFTLTKDHFIITKDIDYPWEFSDFRKGTVYINQERTDELEAEGYARELVRRVQAARKKAGLNKADEITLFIKTNNEGVSTLKDWVFHIQEKVGAAHMKISQLDPAKKHEHHAKEKIKDFEFEFFFD